LAAVSYLRLHGDGAAGLASAATPRRALKISRWNVLSSAGVIVTATTMTVPSLPVLTSSRSCPGQGSAIGAGLLPFQSRQPEAQLIISYELVTVPADNEPGAPIAPCGVCNMEILLLSVVLILVMITLGLAFIVLDDVKFDGRMLDGLVERLSRRNS
jgi:hypothetical protein